MQNIRLFAFGETDAQLLAAYHQALVQAAPVLFAETEGFTAFRQKRPLVASLSGAFEEARLILLCAAAPVFLPLKALLLDGMALGSFTDPTVLARLEASGSPREEQHAHARIPLRAQPFLTQDGRFSGFAAQEGPQIFIYLPILPGQEPLGEGLAEYLQGLEFAEAAEWPPRQEAEPDSIPLLAQRAAAALFAAGVDAALTEKETAPYLRQAVSSIAGNEKLFYPAEDETPQGNLSQKEYVGLLAKQAREQQNAVLGIAVSPVLRAAQEGKAQTETREEYLYLALADEMHVRVVQFYAGADEPREALLDSAIVHLLELMLDYAKQKGFSPPKAMAQPEFEERQRRFSPAYALIAAGAVLLCLLIVLFAKAAGNEDENPSAKTTTQRSAAAQGNAQDAAEDIADFMERQQQREQEKLQQTENVTVQTSAKPVESNTVAAQTTKARAAQAVAVTTTAAAKTTKPARENPTQKSTRVPEKTTREPAKTTAASTKKVQPKVDGDFVFRVYGYGHGVGMSQAGAIALAKKGEKYTEILAHYFPGTSIAADSQAPETVTYAGEDYPLAEYLVRTAEAEIGSSAPTEAFRAQVVLAYTDAARRGFKNLGKNAHAFSSREPKEENLQTVLALLGMKKEQDSPTGIGLYVGGKPVLAPYFSSSAGQTVSSSSVWGGAQSANPHLRGGIDSPEAVSSSETAISAAELRALVESYNQSDACKTPITLKGGPEDWLEVIRHDGAVSKKLGYVEEIRVGNVRMSGNHFRYYVLDLKIRSHCFSVAFE